MGDFGISIKFKDGENEADIRGLTKEYSMTEVIDSIEFGSKLSKELLIKNDYYALHKTFEFIETQF